MIGFSREYNLSGCRRPPDTKDSIVGAIPVTIMTGRDRPNPGWYVREKFLSVRGKMLRRFHLPDR